MKVGIIDTGVAKQYWPRLVAGQAFVLTQGCVHAGPLDDDHLGHGTRVTQILLEQAPDVSLVIAQVFGQRGATTAVQVAAAFRWLVEQKVDMINCSLGLHADRPALRSACSLAMEQNVLVCASSPAMGQPVYPASYPGIIAVTGDARCQPEEWSWLHGHLAEFGAAVGGGASGGASMACARFTGLLAAHWSAHSTLAAPQLVDYFQRHASRTGPQRREPV